MYDPEQVDDLREVADAIGSPLITAAIDAVMALTEEDEYEDVFRRTAVARRELDNVERLYVHYARHDDLAWTEIGDLLDMSGEGARKKYGAAKGMEEELQTLDEIHKAELAVLGNRVKLARLQQARREGSSQPIVPVDLFDEVMSLTGRYSRQRRELIAQLYPDVGGGGTDPQEDDT